MPIRKSITGNFESFAKRLARLKHEKGLSSADLARAAEVTPTAVWNWENGNTEPRYLTLMKLAERLGVSPAYLEYGDQATPKVDDKEEVLSIPHIVEQTRHQIAEAMGVDFRSVRLLIQLSV